MGDHVYGVTKVVGSSTEGVDAAIRNALAQMAATTPNLDWFDVKEVRGHIVAGKVGHFQVVVEIGHRLEPPR